MATKALLKGKFLALNINIKKEESRNLSSTLKKLQMNIKPKVSRKKPVG